MLHWYMAFELQYIYIYDTDHKGFCWKKMYLALFHFHIQWKDYMIVLTAQKKHLSFQSLQASSVTRTNTLRDVFSFPVLIF